MKMNNKKGKNNMENTEQILRREQDRKILETIFKTIENQKDNQIIISRIHSQNNENENTIFDKNHSFVNALDSFKLKKDKIYYCYLVNFMLRFK